MSQKLLWFPVINLHRPGKLTMVEDHFCWYVFPPLGEWKNSDLTNMKTSPQKCTTVGRSDRDPLQLVWSTHRGLTYGCTADCTFCASPALSTQDSGLCISTDTANCAVFLEPVFQRCVKKDGIGCTIHLSHSALWSCFIFWGETLSSLQNVAKN